MRNRDAGIHCANLVADVLHEINPETAEADAQATVATSTLKDRLDLRRYIATPYERWCATYHEIGHVIGAYNGGATRIEACVRPDGTGRCIAEGLEDPEAWVVFALAGVFAEIKFDPTVIHGYVRTGCGDFLFARHKIDALNASRLWPQLTYRAAAKNAMRFVETHWRQIENLALALNDAGQLDDYAVRLFATCER